MDPGICGGPLVCTPKFSQQKSSGVILSLVGKEACSLYLILHEQVLNLILFDANNVRHSYI